MLITILQFLEKDNNNISIVSFNVEETYLKAIEIIFVQKGAQKAMKIQILGSILVGANFKQTPGLVVASVHPFSFEVVMLDQIPVKSFGIPQT